MTNEELLAKYLENSLSETESAEFQKLLNSSPEFAQDVRELSKIEGFLTAGTISAVVPEDFLAGVENHVAEKIHHDKYHGSGSGNAFNKILSGFWIVPMIFLLGLGGYFLLRNTDEKVQPTQEIPAPVLKNETAKTPEVQPAQEFPAATESEIPQATKQNPALAQNEETAPQPPVADPGRMKASAKNENTNAEKAAFEKTRENLLKARAAGQKAQEAVLLKQAGILSAKMGNAQEAKAYFNDAINLARTLRLTELEAETLGELGIVFKNEGDKGSATDSFKKAIELLKRSGRPAEIWEKELQSIQ